MKNVSRGDKVTVREGDFVEFNEVVERGGHNTYRFFFVRKTKAVLRLLQEN
jgi:hypothetical protein